jgi:hypothetical protein
MSKTTSKSADGVTGHLIHIYGGQYAFRVYNKEDDTFVDYDLMHSDLSVTINDADAFFYHYEVDGATQLDHSPETLGIDDDSSKKQK